MPNRGRFFKDSDRTSYKASEVVGLFVISIILGGVICLICYAVDYSIGKVAGLRNPASNPIAGRRLR